MDTTLLQGLAKLETQDGQKSIKGPNGEDSFNLFNIKDNSGKGYRAYDKAEGSHDAYRVYGSREDSIQDLVGMLERKYPQAFQALQSGDAQKFAEGLKAGGYATDPKYVQKLTGTISSVRAQRGKADTSVAQIGAAGGSATDQLVALRDAGYDDIINDGLAKGYKPEEIVQYLAGAGQAQGQAAHDRRDSQSFLTNVGEGIADKGQQLVRGAKQIMASGDELQQLQAQEAADRADLDKIALRGTGGGKVGSVLPGVAAGVAGTLAAPITGGGSLVALGGAALAGGVGGALEPTVEGESRTQNALVGAGLNAAGAGVGNVVAKALPYTPIAAAYRGAKALKSGEAPMLSGALGDAVKTLEDNGISVAARETSPLLNKIANDAERVVGSGIGQADRVGLRNEQLARALTRRVGDEQGVLDSSYIKSAQQRIGQDFDNALQGVSTDASHFGTSLDGVITSQAKGLQSLQSGQPTKVAQELKARLSAGAVPAEDIKNYRSAIGAELGNPNLDAATRKGYSELHSALTQGLENALPQQNAAKWHEASNQWKHLQALENIVRSTNDSGDITGSKLASAIKQGNFRNAYERGDAPYQDLQRALGALSDGRGGLITNGVDAGAMQALGAYATGGSSLIGAGLTSNMALRLLNSTNPSVRAMIASLSPVKQEALRREGMKAFINVDTGGQAAGLSAAIAAKREREQQ